MSCYDLPHSVIIGGVEYRIRYSWRAVIDILAACADPELDEQCKAMCMLQIFYPDWDTIPCEYWPEACEKACEFIDCGQKDDGKPKPKIIDWEHDAPIIIPEVNKIAGFEVRSNPDIHWWTFFGWFMGIGDGLLASVLHIRSKKAQSKKLEDWERDFYKANAALIDIKAPETDEVKREKESIMKYL